MSDRRSDRGRDLPRTTEPPAPRVTVTRPDADGRPVELLELGSEEARDLPPWVRRLGLVVVVLVVLGLLGVEGADRLAERRARLAAEDIIDVVPGQGGGGGQLGEVQLAVGVRNDGPEAVTLRDARFVAPGLPEVARGSVEVVGSLPPGEEAALLVRFEAACPAVEPTGRVFASVTVVAASGREEVVEVDVTSLPVLLAQACRAPTIVDDLALAVTTASLVDGVLRIGLDVTLPVTARLVAVESPVFGIEVRGGLPLDLDPASSRLLELDLTSVVCSQVQSADGSVRLPVDLTVRAAVDRSGAGDGQGPRPDGRQPDLGSGGFGPGTAVGRDLSDFPVVRRLATALVLDTCGSLAG